MSTLLRWRFETEPDEEEPGTVRVIIWLQILTPFTMEVEDEDYAGEMGGFIDAPTALLFAKELTELA